MGVQCSQQTLAACNSSSRLPLISQKERPLLGQWMKL